MLRPLLFITLLGFATVAPADERPEIDLELARTLHERASALRAEAETRFAAAEPACYERFLVNRCLDRARRERLDSIREARTLEIQARRIELADKQRQAEEAGLQTTVGESRRPEPTPTDFPAAMTDEEAQALRARRAAQAERAEALAREEQRRRDAERAQARAQEEAAAASRAERAAAGEQLREERIRERGPQD
jgi:colicin import membrane protein